MFCPIRTTQDNYLMKRVALFGVVTFSVISAYGCFHCVVPVARLYTMSGVCGNKTTQLLAREQKRKRKRLGSHKKATHSVASKRFRYLPATV